MKVIIYVCFLLGFCLSATSEDKIPVELIVFRSNLTETFYEDSIWNVTKDLHWTFKNSTPPCSTSLYKCACDKLETVATDAKPHAMIIFVVEDLDGDSVCPYTAHTNSPIILQIFHAEENAGDHAIISLNSPAGRLHYEIKQDNFSQQILNVFSIMDVTSKGSLLNPNTPPKRIIFDPQLLHGMLRQNQENIETGKTPIGYIHLGFGLIIIFVAVIIGFLSVDHYPFFEYQISAKGDSISF